MNIKKTLQENSDTNFQQFSSSLLPNINNILGVRTPILRKIAQNLYKTSNYKTFLKVKKLKYFEEYMLKAIIIGLLKEPKEVTFNYIKEFVPQINNWAVCDCFYCSLKFAKNNLETVWNFLQPYFTSDKEYYLRFAYVMLLNYYITDKYIDDVFTLIDTFRNDNYYARMAVAWLISACYIKYPTKTLEYLKKSNLDIWTFNKSIQKICESKKINMTTKKILKTLKK